VEQTDLVSAVHHFRTASILADDAGEDIVRATARIELTGCIISGGAGDWVDVDEVQAMWGEARLVRKGLKLWAMDEYAIGESASSDYVRQWLRQIKERSPGPPDGPPPPGSGFPDRVKAWPPMSRKNGRDTGYRKNEVCDECGCFAHKLSSCSRCGMAHYCSRTCQKKAWKLHKKVCCGEATRSHVPVD
jgi:hypothetical protein